MDTHDIFKRISQGAKFSRKRKHDLVKSTETCVIKNKPEDVINSTKQENSDESEVVLLNSFQAIPQNKKRKTNCGAIESEKKRKQLLEEKINQYRNENNIKVVGQHVPEPVKTFNDLPLISSILLENVSKYGFTDPTPIQKQAIPVMLEGRQVLACAPTGSGKTMAFLLPILHHLQRPQSKGFRALIICPTRELAKQTQRECVRVSDGIGFKVHVLSKINKAIAQYGPKSNGKFDILVTTPNRLCYLLNNDPPSINLQNVEWVIIDEADKLFEDGVRCFRDQLKKIINACSSDKRKIAMFSATSTPLVAKWCVRNMKGLIRVSIGLRNAVTDCVKQELLFVGNEEGKLLAFRNLIRQGLNPPVLVFVQSKERAQQLFTELIYDGINVDAIHADRTQLQRDNTIRSFREGKIWVLICTELMARGVDFKGINLIVNYDFPPTPIAYVHRIGRAGRAGREGKAVTFFTVEDTGNLRSIAHILKQSGQEVPDFMLSIKKCSKREKKKLKNSAPKRKDIRTSVKSKNSGKMKSKKNVN